MPVEISLVKIEGSVKQKIHDIAVENGPLSFKGLARAHTGRTTQETSGLSKPAGRSGPKKYQHLKKHLK